MNLKINLSTIDILDDLVKLSKIALLEWNISTDCWNEEANHFLSKQINSNLVFSAEIDSKIIGYSACINSDLSDRVEEKRLHITNTVIHPDFRRQGIAEKLKINMINYFKSKNIVRITTNHNKSNNKIINLSKKLGFTKYTEKNVDDSCSNDLFFELLLKQ